MRYFRCLAGDVAYESARLTLDKAFGHPNEATKTVTCIAPAHVAPRDSQGRILLAVQPEFLTLSAVAAMLPELLSSGAVEEIDESEYLPVYPEPA